MYFLKRGERGKEGEREGERRKEGVREEELLQNVTRAQKLAKSEILRHAHAIFGGKLNSANSFNSATIACTIVRALMFNSAVFNP